MTNNKKFDPNKHISKIKGKDYLEVKYRLVWFREERPDYGIETEIVNSAAGAAQVKATIRNAEGRIIAQAHKMETKQGFSDYLEKAETGAIGRALAMCGYGTQFTGDDLSEGSRIVGAPVDQITGHANGTLATSRQTVKLGQLLQARLKLHTPSEQLGWINQNIDGGVKDITELSKVQANALIQLLIGNVFVDNSGAEQERTV